ncbi:MAG: methionyl-tRNA formyltransferase [Lachnospiraceae bacterium]|nr:methionyl-tRNA formyltransferase [Lachnospiraceae bacterium]
MRIVFMGTPDLARVVMQSLVDAGHEIAAVLTQPDRPKGRKGEVTCSPVKELALKLSIPVYQPVKVRQDEELIQTLREISPDVIVVAAFGQILPKSILEIPRFGCINVHTSLLPKYRGAAPIQQAIIDGEEYTGATIMYMAEGLDTGDIILQRKLAIAPEDTGETLTEKLAVLGGELICEALTSAENGTITRTPQDESKATYVKVMDKTFGRMDFSRSARELWCFIRGLNPWPSAYTGLNGKMLKIWASRVLSAEEEAAFAGEESAPGCIVGSTKKELYVRCGQGILAITELQLEGKKRMSAEDFLRGCQVAKGTRLE